MGRGELWLWNDMVGCRVAACREFPVVVNLSRCFEALAFGAADVALPTVPADAQQPKYPDRLTMIILYRKTRVLAVYSEAPVRVDMPQAGGVAVYSGT